MRIFRRTDMQEREKKVLSGWLMLPVAIAAWILVPVLVVYAIIQGVGQGSRPGLPLSRLL